MDQEEDTQVWVTRIWESYNANGNEVAASLIEQGLVETNDAAKLLEISGILAFERGELDLAIDRICRAMFEISLSFAGQLVLAKAWLKTGRRSDAETTLTFLVEMVENIPCHMLPDLTHALADIDRDDLALATCRAAFDRHPEDDNAAFGVAFYMHRCGYPSELIKNVVAKAIELNPKSDIYRVNMAAVCCSLKQWNEAYDHACGLPFGALQTLPCQCMASQLRNLFKRFNDHQRLSLIDQS